MPSARSLISPLAIGIYLAVISAGLSNSYYNSRLSARPNTFFKALQEIDRQSIDVRFRLRGPRPGSRNVAVLAIDDRSVSIVGRWPWSRATIARALENAYKFGAKVIASDVVFSEPTDRPEVRLIENLRKTAHLPDTLNAQIQQVLDNTDNDKAYADFVRRHQTNLILGSFSESEENDLPGYTNACFDSLYQNSELAKVIAAQYKPLVVIAQNEIAFPPEFTALYQAALDQIQTKIRAESPIPKTAIEQYQLKNKILNTEADFCQSQFLNPSADAVAEQLRDRWSLVKSTIAGLTAPTFQDWASTYMIDTPQNVVRNAALWDFNIPEIQAQSQNTGFFNTHPDPDGVIRNPPLIMRTGTQYLPSIALQAYLTATGNQTDIRVGPLPQKSKIDGANIEGVTNFYISDSDGNDLFQIPADANGRMLINYAGPNHMFAHASIADLLDDSLADVTVTQRIFKHGRWVLNTRSVKKADFFKNKILFLGATAIGIFDMRNTPFDGDFPGVETHANVVDNLIRHDFLARSPRESRVMPWVVLVLGIIMAVALSQFGALAGLLMTTLVLGVLLLIDRQYLFGKGVVTSIMLPLGEVFLLYVAMTFYKYVTEERAKRELRGTFSKYVSPAIVNEILKDPKNLELGGRKERVTTFFSDVRGFTTISERLDPRALSDLLNSYLTPMTELVFQNMGTLDKYMGDAIMAFFGAPIHYPDHAKYACRCALQSLEKLAELRAEYQKKGLPLIDIGIGLNTGECSVGNMGSQTVRNYTVMGDPVNLASRLEGINKTYGTHIIISEYTHAEVKGDFICREVDWVRVKGKLQPVKIYELLTERDRVENNVIEMAKYFSEGYELYHQRKFDGAIAYFQKAIDRHPGDSTARIYIERCQEFISKPPPDDWDGVYTMKTK